GDRDLLLRRDRHIRHSESGPRGAPRFAPHLLIVADHAIDLGHLREHRRLDLRGASGDDDARIGPRALQATDRLPRLRHRLIGHGATVDDDDILKAGRFRIATDDLGFEGIEPAAESDDVDRHQATDANSAGSKAPSYSNMAGPVIST